MREDLISFKQADTEPGIMIYHEGALAAAQEIPNGAAQALPYRGERGVGTSLLRYRRSASGATIDMRTFEPCVWFAYDRSHRKER